MATHPVLDIVRGTPLDRVPPGGERARPVVRVQQLVPAIAHVLAHRHAGELHPLLALVVAIAVRPGGEHHAGNRLQRLAEERLALPQRLLRRLLFREIPEHQHHPLHRAIASGGRGAAVVDGGFPAVFGDQERVVGQPHHRPQPQHLVHRAFHRLAGLLVDDLEDRASGWPCASASFQPVSRSASPLRNVTRPCGYR